MCIAEVTAGDSPWVKRWRMNETDIIWYKKASDKEQVLNWSRDQISFSLDLNFLSIALPPFLGEQLYLLVTVAETTIKSP